MVTVLLDIKMKDDNNSYICKCKLHLNYVIYRTLQTQQNSSKCRFKSLSYNLQAREEENARQRTEERERLEQQKQELHAKFRRRLPPKFHPPNLGRKDSVQRETDLDISENLLVSPVRSTNKEHVPTEVDDTVC